MLCGRPLGSCVFLFSFPVVAFTSCICFCCVPVCPRVCCKVSTVPQWFPPNPRRKYIVTHGRGESVKGGGGRKEEGTVSEHRPVGINNPKNCNTNNNNICMFRCCGIVVVARCVCVIFCRNLCCTSLRLRFYYHHHHHRRLRRRSRLLYLKQINRNTKNGRVEILFVFLNALKKKWARTILSK